MHYYNKKYDKWMIRSKKRDISKEKEYGKINNADWNGGRARESDCGMDCRLYCVFVYAMLNSRSIPETGMHNVQKA